MELKGKTWHFLAATLAIPHVGERLVPLGTATPYFILSAISPQALQTHHPLQTSQ